MNVLWSSMLLLGIVYGAIQGRMPEVTDGVIRASREAVVLAVSLVGVTGFWAGLMEIAKKAGVIDGLVRRRRGLRRWSGLRSWRRSGGKRKTRPQFQKEPRTGKCVRF